MIWQGCVRSVRPLITGTVRVLGKLRQRLVLVGADHDRIDVARHAPWPYPRWARRGPTCKSVWLSASVCPPSWRMATSKDTRVRVEGFSKISISTASRDAGGLEFRRHALSRLLHGVTHVDDPPERAGIDTIDIQEVPRCHRHGDVSQGALRLRRRLGRRRKAAASAARAFHDLRLRDVERRQQAHDVVACPDRQELLGGAGVDDIARWAA